MNIFFLDKDPVLAAQYQFDIHVNKMMIESCQLLSTAHHVLNSDIDKSTIYKATHKNHPMSKWVYEFPGNYQWLLEHAKALATEFYYRRNKKHKTMGVIPNLDYNISKFYGQCDKDILAWGNYKITTPPLCMFDKYKQNCVIESYREFYKNAKLVDVRGLPMNVFTRRKPPEWLVNG